MNKRTFLQALPATLAALSLGGLCTAAISAEPVKLGYINWADTMALNHVAKYVLETKLQQPVQFVSTDIGIQYGALARGDLDVMLSGWLPTSHGGYYAKHKANLDDIGIIYRGGKNGLAVPTYVPESEVSSIEDLAKPDVKAKLNATITGIEPGGGLMQAADRTLTTYGLNTAGYRLQPSSEAGMLASVKRAYANKQYVVATVWSPHWLFQKWPMRYLADPKGVMGGEEQIHAFGSKQFATKFPKAYAFVKNFKLDIKDVEAIELEGQSTNNYEAAAKKFVDSHPDKLKAWLGQ